MALSGTLKRTYHAGRVAISVGLLTVSRSPWRPARSWPITRSAGATRPTIVSSARGRSGLRAGTRGRGDEAARSVRDVDADHLPVELVIQTATGVLTGRFGPREAVTILASQVPHARARAEILSEREPGWSATHAELLRSISAELSLKLESSPQARDLQAVLSELDRVAQALASP
jgi:hypothetical protein